MAKSGRQNPYEGRFGWLRRIDDWIFNVEMGVLWTFLGVSAVMVFLDVMYRRLAAPDSKVAELVARIFGIENPETVETLTTVGPIASGIVGVGLVYFAFWTAEEHTAQEGQKSKARPLIQAIATSAGLGLLAWIMTRPNVESRWFYTLLYAVCSALWLRGVLRDREDGWIAKLIAFVVVTALFLVVVLK